VAAGRTNREIADALFVTPRTAATHVTHILAKLDVASRTEAAAWAVRYGFA
jgi:DNA-binding CsgD family transcriptional regulator